MKFLVLIFVITFSLLEGSLRIKREAKSLIAEAIANYYYPDNFYVPTVLYVGNDDFDCDASGFAGGFQLANIVGKAQINDVYTCAGVCYSRSDCVAINYLKSTKECYFLSRATKDKSDLWFNTEINSDYYYFKDCASTIKTPHNYNGYPTFHACMQTIPVPECNAWNTFKRLHANTSASLSVNKSEELVLSPSTPYAGFSLDGCGKPYFQPKPEGRTRIVGGTDAVPGSYPWIVRLFYNFGDGSGFLCGGSLINYDTVVTAAHCVLDEDGELLSSSKFTVYLGDYNVEYKEANEKRLGINQIVAHQSYSSDTNKNDIAIMKLSSPVPYYNNVIRPVCLPNVGQKPSNPNTGCILAGWGRISNNNKTTAVKLQQARVPIIDDSTCGSQKIWPTAFDNKTMICAGALDGRANACNGDSGGPLVCLEKDGRYTLFGTVSFGSAGACAKLNKPAVYARVSSYRQWIDLTVNQLKNG